MKKLIFFAVILFLSNVVVSAQTTKVLYFKADLTCCKATACNSLEGDISKIVSENFDKKVSFETVKISNETNAALVKKYKAQSQTVIIEKYDTKGKLLKFSDISADVKTFGFKKDKDVFVSVLKSKIN